MKKEVRLSKDFKAQAAKAVFSISFFLLTYLVILLLAFILTGLSIAGCILLISFKPTFITIALGLGLVSLGVLVLIFLLKFIFKSHKTDRSHLTEITEIQEPKLFNLINEIVIEVGTDFPKKVYLSSEVNASVFYDSSFWSMFLPVKKNLQIGLGLVNSVTKEELKAILAHEFGHFSQRSMKVGSYVYNVNQVIFNMLYDNESYERLIQSWGSITGYFSIFVGIAVKINEGIQVVLRKLYEVVNKSYLGLSREMEFHADEIAASVTGYEPLKKSLLRMSLADNSFDNVLNFYDRKISENIKSKSLFKDQTAVMQFVAELNNLSKTIHLPDINLEEQSKFDKSKLVIKNQWASHPTISDRIERLEKTGFLSEHKPEESANELFMDIVALQQQLTNKIFESVSYEAEAETITSDQFIEQYKLEFSSNSFSKIYNGYYDNKNPISFDLNKHPSVGTSILFEELYSDEKVDWVYTAIALENDIKTLKRISDKSLGIKTFDYDGMKYKRIDADELIEKLKVELATISEKIKENDVNIYHYFRTIDHQNNKSELELIYNEFFAFDKIYEKKSDIYFKLLNELQFVSVTTPYEKIRSNFVSIKPLEETLKKEINLLLEDHALTNEITQDIKENLEKYTSSSLEYFGGVSYFDENLNIFYAAMDNYSFLLSRKYFLMKRRLLRYQENLKNYKAIEL